MTGKQISHEYSGANIAFLNNSSVNIDAIAYFAHSFFTFNVFWHEILERATWILSLSLTLTLFSLSSIHSLDSAWIANDTYTERWASVFTYSLHGQRSVSLPLAFHVSCNSLTLSLSLLSRHLRTAYFIAASSIYGQLLVVICLSLLAAKNTTNKIPVIFFEVSVAFVKTLSTLSTLFLRPHTRHFVCRRHLFSVSTALTLSQLVNTLTYTHMKIYI